MGLDGGGLPAGVAVECLGGACATLRPRIPDCEILHQLIAMIAESCRALQYFRHTSAGLHVHALL